MNSRNPFSKTLFLIILCLFYSTFTQAKPAPEPFAIETLWQKLENEVRSPQTDENVLALHASLSQIRNNDLARGQSLLQIATPPENFRDLFDYGVAALGLAQGKPDMGWSNLERLVQKYPTDPDVVFLQSRFLAEKDNLLGAIDTLNTNLTLKQKVGETYLQRGLLSTMIFDYEGALHDFSRALKALKKDQTAYLQMTYFQMGLIELKYNGNEKRAAMHFRQGKKLNPNSPLVEQLEQSLR